MSKNIKFMFSTLVAVAAMTSTAWAESTTEMTTLYVDSSVTESTETTFADITSAIQAAENLGGATINLGNEVFSGNTTGLANAKLFQTNGTYTFTGGNYVDFAFVDTPRPTTENAGKVAVNIVFDNAKVTAGKFRLDNGSSLTITNSYVDAQIANGASVGWTTFYGDSTVSVTNSVIGWYTTEQSTESSEITAGDRETNYYNIKPYGTHIGDMCYVGSGVMKVSQSTVFTYVTEDDKRISLGVYDKGLMSFTDSSVYAYTLMVGVENGNKSVGRDNEVATMIFNNSTLRNSVGEGGERIIVGKDTAGKLIIENNSVVDKSGAAMTVNGNGSVSVTDSVLDAQTVINNGTLTVSGKSALKIDSVTSSKTLDFGERVFGEDGHETSNDGVNNLTFGSSTAGKAMSVDTTSLYVRYSDVTLTSDVNLTVAANGYFTTDTGTWDLGGKTLSLNGMGVFENTTFKNGTLKIDSLTDRSGNTTVCFQSNWKQKQNANGSLSWDHVEEGAVVIDATATVQITNTAQLTIYSDTEVRGVLSVEKNKNGVLIGYDKSEAPEDVSVTVSGENASFSVAGNINIGTVANSTDSSLKIEKGGKVSTTGTLTNAGTISLTDASLTAVNVKNSGAITLVNSTLTITGTLTNTGTLNLDSKSQILGANGETGVSVSNTTINVSDANVAISVAAAGVIFKGVEKLATDGITTEAIANVKVLGAWDFDITANNNEVTVTVDVGELSAADQANLAILHKADDATDWTKTEIKGEYKDGKVTFKTNSFSSYAVAIPEPSTFGLLAGLGALALVGARRRRR